ncbi:pentapeptide repeat-containing protein [Mesorhizobium atlanticum]|uniref:Pentapeptide repeat-containing protein n=1 Tax=Mesorhizobium atlanticum TaxID=2233532 RepID=A0A330GPN1_9HYPH|nr:pentapeptide repeat-containing protein [Mesorhizobium atlanticum]RAZ75824.1 hypothetical protein DPM35_13825 [Mesorhizobium atlanticum]
MGYVFKALGRFDAFVESLAGPTVKFIETRAIFKILANLAAVAGFIVLLLTALQIRADFADRAADRLVKAEDAKARAWEVLLRPAGGNTGKGAALTYLVNQDKDLTGVDLSCKTLGGWDDEKGRCTRAVIFSDVEFAGPSSQEFYWNVDMSKIDFSDAAFYGAKFTDFSLREVDFSRTEFNNLEARDSYITGRFDDAKIVGCSLIETTLIPSGKPPTIDLCDVSGATLNWPGDTIKGRLFAWADKPPLRSGTKKLPGPFGPYEAATPLAQPALDKITLCDPPKDKAGKPLPLGQRPSLEGILPTVRVDLCRRLTTDQAKAKFPEAFRPTSFPNWLKTWSHN